MNLACTCCDHSVSQSLCQSVISLYALLSVAMDDLDQMCPPQQSHPPPQSGQRSW